MRITKNVVRGIWALDALLFVGEASCGAMKLWGLSSGADVIQAIAGMVSALVALASAYLAFQANTILNETEIERRREQDRIMMAKRSVIVQQFIAWRDDIDDWVKGAKKTITDKESFAGRDQVKVVLPVDMNFNLASSWLTDLTPVEIKFARRFLRWTARRGIAEEGSLPNSSGGSYFKGADRALAYADYLANGRDMLQILADLIDENITGD